MGMPKLRPPLDFYPRPPRGGRHYTWQQRAAARLISTHALREEGDVPEKSLPDKPPHFYPRPPRGGRPPCRDAGRPIGRFLPTPSARRATRCSNTPPIPSTLFLPTPSARRATTTLLSPSPAAAFLPTPSARRATAGSCYALRTGGNFYPRPPRGGRHPSRLFRVPRQPDFYPRPPRGGRPNSCMAKTEAI